MTQIENDVDPVVNVAARSCYETRRAESVVEYPTEAAREHRGLTEDDVELVPVSIEAKRNQFDNLVLESYAWLGCNVTQHFDVTVKLDKKFDRLVDRYDLDEVDEFSDPDDLLGGVEGGQS